MLVGRASAGGVSTATATVVVGGASDGITLAASSVASTTATLICGMMVASSARVAVVDAVTGTTSTMVSDRATVIPPEATTPVMRTTRDIVACVVVEASVAAAIAPEHARVVVVEVTYAVVTIDGEMPGTTIPRYRIQEVICCGKDGPLPVEEDVAKVGIAICQVVAINEVILCGETEQVVEVDFVAVIVLLIVQVKLVCHLVRDETGFFASAFVTHGVCGEGAAGEDEGEDNLFHSCILFRVLNIFFFVLMVQRSGFFLRYARGNT